MTYLMKGMIGVLKLADDVKLQKKSVEIGFIGNLLILRLFLGLIVVCLF